VSRKGGTVSESDRLLVGALLEWFEAAEIRTDQQLARVIRLVRILQELEQKSEVVKKLYLPHPPTRRNAYDRANRLLERYRFVLQISPIRRYRRPLPVKMYAADPATRKWESESDWPIASEEAAVGALLRLFELGRLSRFRHCLRCERWFYAPMKHKKFCSTSCQIAHFQQTDRWKGYRQKYMRQYRRRTKKN
jgi:hypothetical protein